MAVFRLQAPERQQRIKAAILEGAQDYMNDGEVRIPFPALLYRARKPATQVRAT